MKVKTLTVHAACLMTLVACGQDATTVSETGESEPFSDPAASETEPVVAVPAEDEQPAGVEQVVPTPVDVPSAMNPSAETPVTGASDPGGPGDEPMVEPAVDPLTDPMPGEPADPVMEPVDPVMEPADPVMEPVDPVAPVDPSDPAAPAPPAVAELPNFSFFMTSEAAIRRLGGDTGFGGDLRYGEEHALTGADKLCTEIAETSMPGSSVKVWRAFLSVHSGLDGNQVNAIDRIGEGPWYDRLGRVIAMNKAELIMDRPPADPVIRDDVPNEDGVPNHRPDPTGPDINNHHVLTGSNQDGTLDDSGAVGEHNCDDWTSTALDNSRRPAFGYSYPVYPRRVQWLGGAYEAGCGKGFNLAGGGGPQASNPVVGSGGGYGAIYCFALQP